MQALNIFHVLVAIAMVAFILVQRGPGATAGAAFGSGASGTVFGARGAGSFLSRSTWVLATLFCVISLTMAVVVSRNLAAPEVDLGVMSAPTTSPESTQSAPAVDDLPMPVEGDSDVPVLPMEAQDQATPSSPEPAEADTTSGDDGTEG